MQIVKNDDHKIKYGIPVVKGQMNEMIESGCHLTNAILPNFGFMFTFVSFVHKSSQYI